MWLGKEKPRDERGFDRPVAFQASANATGLSTRLFGKKGVPRFVRPEYERQVSQGS